MESYTLWKHHIVRFLPEKLNLTTNQVKDTQTSLIFLILNESNILLIAWENSLFSSTSRVREQSPNVGVLINQEEQWQSHFLLNECQKDSRRFRSQVDEKSAHQHAID